jgi:hypothetical protein
VVRSKRPRPPVERALTDCAFGGLATWNERQRDYSGEAEDYREAAMTCPCRPSGPAWPSPGYGYGSGGFGSGVGRRKGRLGAA